MPDLELSYRLQLMGRWHFGSGLERGTLDRAILRDGRGVPYIPGSHLKGRLREAVEWICRILKLPVFEPHSLDDESARRFALPQASGNPVERLFGARDREGSLIVGHAHPDGTRAQKLLASPDALLPLRRVSMDRGLGRARDRRLFYTEYGYGLPSQPAGAAVTEDTATAPSVTFRGRILARHVPQRLPTIGEPLFSGWEPGWPLDWSILAASLLALERVGGDVSTGAGACEIDLENTRWRPEKGREWKSLDNPHRLLKPLESLGCFPLFQMAEPGSHGAESRLPSFLQFAKDDLGCSLESIDQQAEWRDDWSMALEYFDETSA